MDHLEPIGTEFKFDVTKPGITVFDRLTREPIVLNENSDRSQWGYVDGKPMSWGDMQKIMSADKTTPRFTKYDEKIHNIDNLVNRLSKKAESIIKATNANAKDNMVRLGSDQNAALIAEEAAQLLNDYQERFGASHNNSLILNKMITRAMTEFYKRKFESIQPKGWFGTKKDDVTSLEPFLEKQFITFKTDLGLEPKDTLNTSEENIAKLYKLLSGVSYNADIEKHRKNLGKLIKQHKNEWNKVKSHGGYDNPPPGWDPFIYWLKDMLKDDTIDRQTLEAVYTKDSILAFQNALEANPSYNDAELSKMRKLLKPHTN